MSETGEGLRNLAKAIDEHDPNEVLEALTSGVDVNAEMDHPNPRPLHAALHEVVDGAPVDLVTHLISFNADVNLPDGLGFLPLGITVTEERKDLVDILLNAGADPNMRSSEGELPLHIAVENGNHEICMSLLDHGATETIDEWSAASGLTPLGSAAQQLDLAMIELLRKNGALVSARDEDYKTAKQRLPVWDEDNWADWEKAAQLLE